MQFLTIQAHAHYPSKNQLQQNSQNSHFPNFTTNFKTCVEKFFFANFETRNQKHFGDLPIIIR